MKPIIELKDYSYKYENRDELVLKNITMTINEGDFVGIIGCNKAGKSTLCKNIVGILPFVSGGQWDGEIVVDGKSMNDTKGVGVTDIIGIVFQDAESQFTQSTVEDEIAFAMCNFGYDREVIRERIKVTSKACGLEDMLSRSPYRLSGGQQQRLAVACILALQPRVIILDETTSQLDPIGRDEVFKLVSELHAQGTTVIMVDHNIEKIADFCDKVAVLDDGKLIAFGETHEVFENKVLLNEHHVRVPQVTDAALSMKEVIDTTNGYPIKLKEAEKAFASLKQGDN